MLRPPCTATGAAICKAALVITGWYSLAIAARAVRPSSGPFLDSPMALNGWSVAKIVVTSLMVGMHAADRATLRITDILAPSEVLAVCNSP